MTQGDRLEVTRTNQKHIKVIHSISGTRGKGPYVYQILAFAELLKEAIEEGMSTSARVSLDEFWIRAEETIVQEIP